MPSMRRFSLVLAVALVLHTPFASAQRGASTDPILLLVSYDGWRASYYDTNPVPNLKAIAAHGVRATEMIPSFPVFTFPNHYTIVTGLYPAHHGIVANNMEEPGFPEKFTMSADTATDPRWWGGEPIWVTAIKQGQRSATMFWPGADAAIQGVRATYGRRFDKDVNTGQRVAQVLEWLALPEAQRPSIVTLYLEEVDHAGHDSGPDSAETHQARSEERRV